MRDITRAMLAELSNLAAQMPDLAISERAEQFGLRLPAPGTQSTPPHSRAGSTAGGSRPGSARSGGSVRSTGSAARAGSRPGVMRNAQLGL